MFSIIIPVKNEANFLPKLLASIRAQTLQPLEIIVADAGSTDATVSIAESFGAKVVPGGMPGPGRNRGAERAQSDHLLFLDADVELQDPHFLEKTWQEIQKRQLDFAAPELVPLSTRRADHFSHRWYNRVAVLLEKRRPFASGCCIFARASSHNKIHGFDETILLAEDHDYVMRGSKAGLFGVLRTVSIPVSVRRFDKDGRLRLLIKFTLAAIYITFIGPIRTDIFRYSLNYKK